MRTWQSDVILTTDGSSYWALTIDTTPTTQGTVCSKADTKSTTGCILAREWRLKCARV